MKKKITGISLLFLIILCTGCNGTITRDLRHDGFSVSDKFICDEFYPEKKNDTSYKKVKYMTDKNIIDSNGYIYEISLGQLYSNKQNCKKASTSIVVKAIYDNKIIKGTDNKYYYFDSYSLIPETDNSYELYKMLLGENNVVKVMTANTDKGIYYLLKSDGNIYSYTITKADYNSPYKIISRTIAYDKSDYGSNIIDFNYVGDNPSTYIKTEDSIHRMKAINYSDCSKYADVSCIYEMQKDEVINKYKDRIIAYNGKTVITDYKQIFTISE